MKGRKEKRKKGREGEGRVGGRVEKRDARWEVHIRRARAFSLKA